MEEIIVIEDNNEELVVLEEDITEEIITISEANFESAKLQEKEVIPKIVAQEITPDSGYDGFSKIKVEAIPIKVEDEIMSIGFGSVSEEVLEV